MRIANIDSRINIIAADGVIDVAEASKGRFEPDIQKIYDRWAEFRAWADAYQGGFTGAAAALEGERIGPPVPRPPQVFAVGLNYRAHAQESGAELPKTPMVFTKFPSAVTGPFNVIELPAGSVDWEIELVAVIGREARHVAKEEAWSHIAGLTVGQDLSERDMQVAPPAPQQFSLAKSYEGFAPIGPVLVTPDELADPNDLELSCALSGEVVQHSRTSDLIFSIADIVAHLSSVLRLQPGDLIFTGTPSGVGWARAPKRFISATDELVSTIEGIGQMRHRFRRA